VGEGDVASELNTWVVLSAYWTIRRQTNLRSVNG